MVRANFKFDIQGLRVWLEEQGHLASDLPANWDPVWSDPRGKDQPEDWEKRLGAAAHLALPGHGWIVDEAAPSSVKCRICGVATAIWLCSMAVAEAKKDLAHVTVFAAELGKIRSLVDQARRRYAKAAGRYREEHVLGIRGFLESAKAAVASVTSADGEKAAATSAMIADGAKAAATSATSADGEKAAATSANSVQGEGAARYFEERLRDVEKGTTVRLMDNLALDSMFDGLGNVLFALQQDVLVDTRNPGYAQPGVVAKGHPVNLRTRVERCLRAVGFTHEEIGEQLIRSIDDPVNADASLSPDDGRSRAEMVRDRVSPRRHRSKR